MCVCMGVRVSVGGRGHGCVQVYGDAGVGGSGLGGCVLYVAREQLQDSG